MFNVIIIGTGKIGIDLYIKLKKKRIFNKIYIFNTNKNSEGAKFCKKNNFLYSDQGIRGVISKLSNVKIGIIEFVQFLAKITDRYLDKYEISRN